MLFNSYEFIFIFLPIVFFLFYMMSRYQIAALSLIIFSSLIFYSFWNLRLLPIIMISIAINYCFVKLLERRSNMILLAIGILINIGLLGYFKYYNFFIDNINYLLSTNIEVPNVVLPLAISFFTFQQSGYLVDTYRGETKGQTFGEYVLFVVFFPQLIAGPIVRHGEIIPQIRDRALQRLQFDNIEKGLTIFFIGLFKKAVIADTLAHWVSNGFNNSSQLNVVEGWISALSYTFQLYFDFSGYCDMAIGIALLFNIKLPINFDSPYKSLNIQQFWQKWHMTLNRFLTHYLYIPLGGSLKGRLRTYVNILLVFLVSGLWHGAGWTFIFWGLLHGLASVIYRVWKHLGLRLFTPIAWGITFLFVICSWVFFRANSMDVAMDVLQAMIRFDQLSLPIIWGEKYILFGLFVLFLVVVGTKNSIAIIDSHHPGWRRTLFVACLAAISFIHLNQVSEFLYFNF